MKRSFVALAACALLAGPLAGQAWAHGHREVGEIEWTVGWAEEPAFVGLKNGVQLVLTLGPDGPPVEGAEKDLRVVVSIGDEQTESLELRTVFESPGEYRADLIPTVPGDYTFRFTGTIDGEGVDESWTGSKDDFSQIEGTSDVTFPKAAPTNAELAERLEAVESTASDAEDAVMLPRILGIVGVVLALIALLVAGRPRRTRA